MHFASKTHPLLVIIGPSGSGKSSVIQELVSQGLIEVTPTWTTRPPRDGELASAIEHRFVSVDEFNRYEANDHFLETVELFGLPYRYGLPRVKVPEHGRVPLIMLRVMLLASLPKHYSNYKIYQIEDNYERVKKRLLERAESEQSLGTRLTDYEKEVEHGREAANRVFENTTTIEKLAQEIATAIKEDFNA